MMLKLHLLSGKSQFNFIMGKPSTLRRDLFDASMVFVEEIEYIFKFYNLLK